jgi:uncharacterized membrane protein
LESGSLTPKEYRWAMPREEMFVQLLVLCKVWHLVVAPLDAASSSFVLKVE